MADQNTLNEIANRLATALSHHLREDETMNVAKTHSLEEEVVDTLYKQLAEWYFIPKNSCDEPLCGTRVDEEQQVIYEMGAEIERLKAENAKLLLEWRDEKKDAYLLAEKCEKYQDFIEDSCNWDDYDRFLRDLQDEETEDK